MKNNFLSKLLFFLIFFIYFLNAYSDELKFEASSIEIIDKDKIIVAKEGVKILSGDEMVIYADEMKYDKVEKFLDASGNIKILNLIENIQIISDKISYDKNLEKIVSSGNVKIEFEKNYTLNTKEIIYLKNSGEILINHTSKIKDNLENEIEFQQLNFNANDKLIKDKRVKLLDSEKNSYKFNSAILDFSKNKIIADNVSIDFNKNIFGNPLNDPRLKGNYFFLTEKTQLLKKVYLQLVKKMMIVLLGKLKQKKLITIKKKIINYKHAWLEIYDKPIIYFPKFFILIQL